MKKKLRYCTPQLHKLNDMKTSVCADGSSAGLEDNADCSGGIDPDAAYTAYCSTGTGAGNTMSGGCRLGAAASACDAGSSEGTHCGTGTSPDIWA